MKLTIALALLGSALAVAQPRIVNGSVQTRGIAGDPAAEVQKIVSSQAGPVWIGYAVPIAGEHRSCCYYSDENGSYRGCSLEKGDFKVPTSQAAQPVQLEPATEATILYRAEGNAITDIRNFTADCELDAGGRTVYWFTGVAPAASVSFLKTFADGKPVTRSEEHRIRLPAVHAIGMHADPAAGPILDGFTSANQPEDTRRAALHALGWRGKAGFDALNRFLATNPEERLRQVAIRALATTKQPEAIQVVTNEAENGKSARVRGEALLVLGQFGGMNAVPVIQKALSSDPDSHVRRQAVVALTQLPSEQGVPLLIGLARSNKDEGVRRTAVEWLARSHDQRAEQFVNEILSK